MTNIKLPRNIVNQILMHAQSSEAQEICGLVSEKNGQISHCYPVENTADDPVHFFRMDAKSQIDALRVMRENGEDLFAIYHSHPDSEAYPSATDIQQSQYPDAIYMIVSLNTKGVLDLRAYQLNHGQVQPLELSI